MKFFDRAGNPILDWRDWTRPKKASQWRASRSAMELARAWFTSVEPVTPPEISALLNSHERSRNAVLETAWPELVTALPQRGEGRNHDLILLGSTRAERLLVAVEAKVDESMGPAIGPYWEQSKQSTKSGAWRRIDALLHAVFGKGALATREPWSTLPYQMLTAVVGTAIEANHKSTDFAISCIHELVTESAKSIRLSRNEAEFSAFLAALGYPSAIPGQLYGPLNVTLPGISTSMPILIGKAQYNWAIRELR
jgi:hypothetical protein